MSCIIDLDLTNSHDDATKPCTCGSCSMSGSVSGFVSPQIVLHIPDNLLQATITLSIKNVDGTTTETSERIIDQSTKTATYNMPLELFTTIGIFEVQVIGKQNGTTIYQSSIIKFNVIEKITSNDAVYINLVDYTQVPHIFNVQKAFSDTNATPDLDDVIKDVRYNASNGVFTFTRYDGNTFTIDTPNENITQSGYYDATTKEIVLVLVSGGTIRIPASSLVDIYTGGTSATIQVSVSSDNVITASLVSGSITKTLLSTDLQSEIENKVDKVEGKGLSSNDYTTEEKTKLAGLENYDDTEIQAAVSSKAEQADLTNEINARQTTDTNLQNQINTKANASDIPTTLPNPNSLTIKQSGTTKGTYNGSEAIEVDLIVDDSLNLVSTNPVQNKIIKSALDRKADTTAIPTKLPNPKELTVKQNGVTKGTYDGSSAVEINLDGSGADTHPVNVITDTTFRIYGNTGLYYFPSEVTLYYGGETFTNKLYLASAGLFLSIQDYGDYFPFTGNVPDQPSKLITGVAYGDSTGSDFCGIISVMKLPAQTGTTPLQDTLAMKSELNSKFDKSGDCDIGTYSTDADSAGLTIKVNNSGVTGISNNKDDLIHLGFGSANLQSNYTDTDGTAKRITAGVYAGNGFNVYDTNGNSMFKVDASTGKTYAYQGLEVKGGIYSENNIQVGIGSLIQADPNGAMEFGRTDGTQGTPYIDFHSNSNPVDYDVRLIVTNSNNGTSSSGQGTLNIYGAGGMYLNGQYAVTVVESGTNFIRYSDGTQICWGRVTSGSEFTYGKPFINDILYGLSTISENGDWETLWIHSCSASGATIKSRYNGRTIRYIAVGRWK